MHKRGDAVAKEVKEIKRKRKKKEKKDSAPSPLVSPTDQGDIIL
jgi:hypothetical protein